MSPLRTLAWAASLLLGVGLGWAGRSAWEPGDRGDRLAPAEPAPAFEAASPETAVGQRGEDVDVDAAGRARAAGEADATAGRRKLADRAAAEGAPAEPAPERAAANEVKEPRTVADSVRPDVAIQPLAAARTAEANREPEERVWVPAGPADAARWVGGSLLLVEGLPVEDRAVSMGEGVPVTRVRQRLPSGALLEVHLRPAPEAGANRRQAARDAWTPVDGLEARLHGPVAPDSLAVLLSRLRAPAP